MLRLSAGLSTATAVLTNTCGTVLLFLDPFGRPLRLLCGKRGGVTFGLVLGSDGVVSNLTLFLDPFGRPLVFVGGAIAALATVFVFFLGILVVNFEARFPNFSVM
jgi:hypothetical protein